MISVHHRIFSLISQFTITACSLQIILQRTHIAAHKVRAPVFSFYLKKNTVKRKADSELFLACRLGRCFCDCAVKVAPATRILADLVGLCNHYGVTYCRFCSLGRAFYLRLVMFSVSLWTAKSFYLTSSLICGVRKALQC